MEQPVRTTEPAVAPPEVEQWFAKRGWRIRRHQAEMLCVADAGRHALLVADTGAGKTLAGFLPTLAAFCPSRLAGAEPPDGLHTLYVSPLKALAADVQRNLVTPVAEMSLPLQGRDTQRRYSLRPQEAAARETAPCPPHNAGKPFAAAILS